ncbi:hypothetical protein SS50377_27626 [Spironucleus salmonicida]|uniref:Uncharacterized protein n=1 Tax=Spironucleus salmonicida TaxID=348837 RepID=V6LPJ5_9EUKA|nr:hypothetical protein SS50377_27626 [Spironucleus salmonicida]|eukprot:EST46597.1 Hypothetical protein SS50377_13401 [Spironucleus salmonicida]
MTVKSEDSINFTSMNQKLSDQNLNSQASGFGSLDLQNNVIQFNIQDVFTVVRSKKPSIRTKQYRILNITAKQQKDFFIFTRKSKLRSYLTQLSIKVCDRNINYINWQLAVIEKQFNDILRVQKLKESQQDLLQLKIQDRQKRIDAAQFKRYIIGETKIKFCQKLSLEQINRQA